MAVIDFNSNARIVCPVTRAVDLDGRLKRIRTSGSTNLCGALGPVPQLIDTCTEQQDSWEAPVVVLFSDGNATHGGSPLPAADQLKQRGVIIVTIAYGSDADLETLREVYVVVPATSGPSGEDR